MSEQEIRRGDKYRVTVQLDGKHPLHEDYPLLPGDILVWQGIREKWAKVAPGLGIFGFDLAPDDVETLEPAPEARWVIV